MQLTDDEDLYKMVLHAPIGICILDAATFKAEIVNDKFLEIAGKPKEAILGKWYWEPFAEVRAIYETALTNVPETGQPFYADEVELMLIRHGKEEKIFVTFVYAPIQNETGNVTKVAVWVLENTRQVAARQQIEAAKLVAQKERDRLNSFLMQANAGICVLSGPELVYEMVNPKYQELLPGRNLLGRPIFEALPELVGTPIQQILLDVYSSGNPAVVNELLIPISEYEGGPTQDRYFSFNYQARYDENEQIDGLLAFVYEVTATVAAKQQLQSGYEQLRLAKEAAQLGFFDLDMVKGTLIWDERCRELFGISHDDEVTYEKDFVTGLHPEDRERILRIIDNVFIKSVSNGVYDVEYRTVGAENQQIRWVRAKGQAYFNENDQPMRFIGSVLDITEQKEDELRKNDFIGMVSHELKTPLTSLTAIVQMANQKLKGNNDAFLSEAMGKASTLVKRMGTMITGFLTVSRLESGKLVIEKTTFDLKELIDEIIQEVRLTASRHQFSFHCDSPAMIFADRNKIGSVITNLITNAIKYSAKGKLIALACRSMPDNFQVSVADEGMGISEQDQAKIFDRYFRVENQNSQHISGFGIGLYLSAEIIREHGGKIWVESESGKGSTFFFSLPLPDQRRGKNSPIRLP